MTLENCRVRNVKESDLSSIYLIELKSFKYPYPLQLFVFYYKLSPETFIVVECSSNVVGYAIGLIEGDVGHIISLAVDPKFRGRGLGKLLLRELEKRLVSAGAKVFKLEVSVNNLIALRMYTSLGYRVVNLIRNYYPDGSDAYLMIKEAT